MLPENTSVSFKKSKHFRMVLCLTVQGFRPNFTLLLENLIKYSRSILNSSQKMNILNICLKYKFFIGLHRPIKKIVFILPSRSVWKFAFILLSGSVQISKSGLWTQQLNQFCRQYYELSSHSIARRYRLNGFDFDD